MKACINDRLKKAFQLMLIFFAGPHMATLRAKVNITDCLMTASQVMLTNVAHTGAYKYIENT